MKIWHVGANPSPEEINGVNNTIWPVAIEQCHQGDSVSLILERKPDKNGIKLSHKEGLQWIKIPARPWGYDCGSLKAALISEKPDVVHFHSIFIPKQALFARLLKQQNIPYVITPNAITPQLLKRGWLKKWIYSALIEKSYFRAASGIAVVTPPEQKALHSFLPGYSGIVHWIPNPINPSTLTEQQQQHQTHVKRIVYLGRFDVWQKGIDRLVEIGRLLPEIELHLYGTKDRKTRRWLHRIQRTLPKNIYFHPPVFGTEKLKVLTEASLYIQMSRWEVFGISIAEAMMLGIPCAIANTINLAELFQSDDLGLVLSTNPSDAAQQLRQTLKQPKQLQKWSQQGQTYAQTYFHSAKIATQYLKLYQEVMKQGKSKTGEDQEYIHSLTLSS
ncbi:MAG: glycosyltransferase family 4 protein [Microcoleaceae cyanobacterium]